jgi:ubiquinone/menaquinone biosynthesis C-methylase UbiE
MQNSTTRFSNRVEQYVKYRPTYPKDIIPFLERTVGLNSSFAVTDIGSGTGISSKIFLDYGNMVYAVEPNKEMRNKAEELLQQYNSFISINGTAEQTTLEDASADMIISGQAFHWFDATKTKKEFRRIAKAHTYCVLIWNERLVASPFEKAYEQLLLDYSGDYKNVNHKNISEQKIADFFSPNNFILQVFPNKQVFDFEALKGRLLSSSYTPDESHPSFRGMIDTLQKNFEKYQINNTVQFNYETKLYTGKILITCEVV